MAKTTKITVSQPKPAPATAVIANVKSPVHTLVNSGNGLDNDHAVKNNKTFKNKFADNNSNILHSSSKKNRTETFLEDSDDSMNKKVPANATPNKKVSDNSMIEDKGDLIETKTTHETITVSNAPVASTIDSPNEVTIHSSLPNSNSLYENSHKNSNSTEAKIPPEANTLPNTTVVSTFASPNQGAIDIPKKTPTRIFNNPYSTPKIRNVAKGSGGKFMPVTPSTAQKKPILGSELGIGTNAIIANNNYTDGKAIAMIRCAYIETVETQTVVFWFEERDVDSYKVQFQLNQLIDNEDPTFMTPIPFGVGINRYMLFWHKNNKLVFGKNGEKHGMRLFHYTLMPPFQNKTQMVKTAHAIADEVNSHCKTAKSIVDDNRLFYFNSNCVWSSLTDRNSCIKRINKESNDKFNDANGVNPLFWLKHEKIIRKYFFKGTLTVELAQMFNAPIEEIAPHVKRTQELIDSVGKRRALESAIPNSNDNDFGSIDNDPYITGSYIFDVVDKSTSNLNGNSGGDFVNDLTDTELHQFLDENENSVFE